MPKKTNSHPISRTQALPPWVKALVFWAWCTLTLILAGGAMALFVSSKCMDSSSCTPTEKHIQSFIAFAALASWAAIGTLGVLGKLWGTSQNPRSVVPRLHSLPKRGKRHDKAA